MEPVDVLIMQAEKIGKLERALETIFTNVHRQEPSVFRLGVLTNIEMALGKERYEYLKSYHE